MKKYSEREPEEIAKLVARGNWFNGGRVEGYAHVKHKISKEKFFQLVKMYEEERKKD